MKERETAGHTKREIRIDRNREIDEHVDVNAIDRGRETLRGMEKDR